MKKLLFKALIWIGLHWKHFDIVKTVEGEEVLYLRRWFIWRCRWFNIFLHYIPQPDSDRDPHDHPWDFRSLLLRGGYDEDVYMRIPPKHVNVTNYRRAPALGKREAETIHQITRVLPGTFTLLLTGPYRRQWGFLTDEGWVHWKKYLNIPEDQQVEMD